MAALRPLLGSLFMNTCAFEQVVKAHTGSADQKVSFDNFLSAIAFANNHAACIYVLRHIGWQR